MSRSPEKLTPAQDLKECVICGRRFAEERIKAHETICQESSSTTRKSFDISQQRIRGTEAEKFAKAAAKNECLSETRKNKSRGLSTNWRERHQQLIKQIRDVKELANEKKQKVNDLPFPPPITYDGDYVQCQYCLRQFNQVSASRHILTCRLKTCKLKSKTNLPSTSMTTNSHLDLTNE